MTSEDRASLGPDYAKSAHDVFRDVLTCEVNHALRHDMLVWRRRQAYPPVFLYDVAENLHVALGLSRALDADAACFEKRREKAKQKCAKVLQSRLAWSEWSAEGKRRCRQSPDAAPVAKPPVPPQSTKQAITHPAHLVFVQIWNEQANS